MLSQQKQVLKTSRVGAAKKWLLTPSLNADSYLQGHTLQGATIYVSGSAQKMPQDVAAVFKEVILQQRGGLSAIDAQNTMRLLTNSHRYVVEAWT